MPKMGLATISASASLPLLLKGSHEVLTRELKVPPIHCVAEGHLEMLAT